MKKVLFGLILPFLILGTANVYAQVTIGANREPHPGAVLDLQSGSKGLKLPVVAIDDVKAFQLSDDGSEAVGMIVYNSKTNTIDGAGTGIYVWDGSKWMIVSSPIFTTRIEVTSEKESADYGEPVQFTATVFPAIATDRNYIWSVIPEGSGEIDSDGLFTSTLDVMGNITVRATALDGSGIYGEKQIAIVTGRGMVEGHNIYCYPEHLGCCMTENSRLGTPAYTTHGEGTDEAQPPGERGYYYYRTQADDACPDGFHLPTSAEWTALASRMPSFDPDKRDAWLGGKGFAGCQRSDSGWGWDEFEDYWLADRGISPLGTPVDFSVRIYVMYGCGGDAGWFCWDGPTSLDRGRGAGSVRCVKSN
jgi:hypothetical protein